MSNAPMYRPIRRYAWDEAAEQVYREKREKLAAKGYVTDEDVARYFKENGVDARPEDVRAMFLDSICASPLARVLAELSNHN